MSLYNPISLRHPDVTLPHALRAAEQIAQRLRSLSSSVGPSSLATQFYTRIRVKAEDSIRKKIARNQMEFHQRSYSFADVDDYIGFRVVTLFDGALNDGMKYVVDLVRAGQQLQEFLFAPGLVWNTFHKAKFFKRTALANDCYARCRISFAE